MTDLEQRAVLVLVPEDGIRTNHPYDRKTIRNFRKRRMDSDLRPAGRYRLWDFIYKYQRQIDDKELVSFAGNFLGRQYKPKATQEA